MTPLMKIIRDVIAAEGPITLAQYMELALQHPEYGYYRINDPLGASGDFITAPEISQMFGELIGVWLADVWHQMGNPNPFVLLELGPGRGTLMQDVLRSTAKVAGFQQAMKLCLLESNAALRKTQKEKLAAYSPVFLDNLASLPDLPILAVANEFFDTMPMRQFVKSKEGWCERLVDWEKNQLVFTLSQPSPAILQLGPAEWREGPEGMVYEMSPVSLAIVGHLAKHMVQHGGAGLIIDYGYATPSGQPTLQGVADHRFVGVLENPGEADVTADVDFQALKGMAIHQGAKTAGPANQSDFLKAMGIEFRASILKRNATEEQAKKIDEDVRRLADPGQMGIQFKVLGVLSPDIRETAGFS